MVAVAGDWGDRRPSHEMLIVAVAGEPDEMFMVAVAGDWGDRTRCLWLLLLETVGTGALPTR